ncbi:MAG: dienelactone hydrolase family protein [Deltaproteobacteria bacterium]|nr:dienelactone hydrolase family protein [Deltaproteobacteria bacterium]
MAENVEKRIQEYRDSQITRREFIHRALVLTGSLAAATTLVDSLRPATANAAQVDPNDPALTSSDVKFAAPDGAGVSGYLTRPRGDGQRPAVLVVHLWNGIDDHIRDVARRLAKIGYVALVPDLLSRQGGTSSFASQEAAIAAGRKLDDDTITRDLAGGVNFLKGQNFVRANRIGVTGFCWGGGKALMFTTRSKDLAASVIYYGASPTNVDDVKNITAPVLAHYGELDERINSGLPKLEEAMKRYGKSFEYKIYAGAPHSFNSDTSPQSYRPEAAKEAWSRTLAFFKKHLED